MIPVAAVLMSWSAAAQQPGSEVTQYKDWTLACEGAKQSNCMIRQSDERWHGLTVWLSHSGMDRDAELLDRLAARASRRRES